MLRFLRFSKQTLCAVLAAAGFAVAIPGAASAVHGHGFGAWLPFPPPPPFFFAPRVVHRHGPYCGHYGYGYGYGYDRYDHYDRYDRRYYDRHDERWDRRHDRRERW
jgi:hypothetical protein